MTSVMTPERPFARSLMTRISASISRSCKNTYGKEDTQKVGVPGIHVMEIQEGGGGGVVVVMEMAGVGG